MNNRLPIDFYIAHSGELLKNDLCVWDKEQTALWNWRTPEIPKPFRNVLITAIDYSRVTRTKALNELFHYRFATGDTEKVMFDSGGFQMLKKRGFNMTQLVYENMLIYREHDWADAYVMPDHPPHPDDPLEIANAKIGETISGTMKLFPTLPMHVQEKSMPVFHVRNERAIENQYKIYEPIIKASKMACYAIPGAKKKLDIKNGKLIKYLSEILPEETKLHTLGIASPAIVYPLHKIGVTSYDAISPRISGANGMVQFLTRSLTFSDKCGQNSGDIEELKSLQRLSYNHTCPFCHNTKKLYQNFRYRVLHNLILYDELNWYFRDMTPERFHELWPKQSDILYELSQSKKGLFEFTQ